MKSGVRIILLLTCISLLYFISTAIMLLWSQIDYYKNINERIQTAFSSEPGSPEPDMTLMTHRMITSDIQSGIVTPENVKRAFSHTNGYFKEVKATCLQDNIKNTEDYLSCANKILGNHFYYYPARETASAWAGHHSDCDLNVYLLLDALQIFNKSASIVYTPGHAFLTWTEAQDGRSAWWETTFDENHGNIADLSNNELYMKTLAPFYYQPQSADFAEHFYMSVVIFNSLKPEERKKKAPQISQRYPKNPLVEDILYEQITSLTPSDIEKIKSRLNIDVSSTTKKYLLANYYMKQGDKDNADKYISKIDINSCGKECQEIRKQTSTVDKLWFDISDLMNKKALKNQYGVFPMDKRKYPVTDIKKHVYGMAIILVIMLALRGARALYSDLKPVRTREK